MEKIVYALWVRPDGTRAALNAALRAAMPGIAAMPGVRSVRLNLQDAAVAAAEHHRQRTAAPQMDAVVQVWLDAGHGRRREAVDAALAVEGARVTGWLVTESTIIPNVLHPPAAGARCEGWAQVCFLFRPERLDHPTWREVWQGGHTAVGVETQSNFEYVQNMVVRRVVGEGPDYAAMVEECFPAEAMTDPAVFFDAVGDAERLQRHIARMMESCARFIDPGGVEVLPTSQYTFG